MHGVGFLQDLAVVMIVAGLVTILFHRFKQPVVLGYIIAGVVIGPYTPPFPLIHDQDAIQTLANLGMILLMFSLGLEFNLGKLKKVGVTALIAAGMEILLMLWVGYEIGQLFGWGRMNSIFLGAMLSMSSTTVIIKALQELGKSKEHFAQLIFGILILEDILAIVMIALLSGIATSGSLQASDVFQTLLRLSIFLIVALVIGWLTVPRLLGYVARFKSNEMLLITVLGLCFGVSLLAFKLGYSVALGAFLIGAVIAESREIGKVEHLMEPVRDMFSAVFFVAIGLMIDPAMLVRYRWEIIIISAAVIVGKVITCSFGAFVAGNDGRTSLRVGMGLAQIGEFSFIIATLGLTLKVTSDFLYPVAVAVSAVTTLLTPYLIQSSDAVVTWFERHAPASVGNSFTIYTRWVTQLSVNRAKQSVGRFIRKWSWQIALNVALIAGIFIAAVFIRQNEPQWFANLNIRPAWADATIWAAALVISMPLLIASYRKLQALGMLLGEVATRKIEDESTRSTVAGVLATSILISGSVALGMVLLLFSAAILPSREILWAVLVGMSLRDSQESVLGLLAGRSQAAAIDREYTPTINIALVYP
jgi:CPA2 family monovalent cation:H+ antiporter-2